MTKLITINKAKEEIRRLEDYITLVESYEADTIEKLVIKNYALTNSIAGVTKILNDEGYKEIDIHFVSSVIKKRPKDDLHSLIRSGYMKRTKHSRNSSKYEMK